MILANQEVYLNHITGYELLVLERTIWPQITECKQVIIIKEE